MSGTCVQIPLQGSQEVQSYPSVKEKVGDFLLGDYSVLLTEFYVNKYLSDSVFTSRANMLKRDSCITDSLNSEQPLAGVHLPVAMMLAG